MGNYTSIEIIAMVHKVVFEDANFATLLSQFATLRHQNNSELESEFIIMVQDWLRRKLPALDEQIKRNKAKLN